MISQKEKTAVDALSYEQLLTIVRFAPVGDVRFQGELGKYTLDRMSELREKVGPAEHTATSKRIGWDKP